MDVLTNKQTRTYEYISRYASFPFYYNTLDKKYVYGITAQLSKSTPYAIHYVKQGDTLDTLSLKYYGRPDYYWVIADFNSIIDPFTPLFGNYNSLNIPSIGSIEFE